MQKIEEFVARVQIVFKAAQHRTGNSNGILFFNPSHDHAQMLSFDDNSNSFRADFVVYGIRDLHRKPLLHLKSASIHVDEPWNLAKADDFSVGNVRDVTLAEERQDVMLAEAVEIDVLDDHHLVVLDGK